MFRCIKRCGHFIPGRIYSSVSEENNYIIMGGEISAKNGFPLEPASFLVFWKKQNHMSENLFLLDDYFVSLEEHREKLLNELIDG